MKKLLCILLVLLMAFTTNTNVYADTIKQIEVEDYTLEEIKKLEPYISVNDNGYFEFDTNLALNNGFDENLVFGQENYLNMLKKKHKILYALVKKKLLLVKRLGGDIQNMQIIMVEVCIPK